MRFKIFILSFFLFSCDTTTSKVISIKGESDSLTQILNDWKQDPFGCKGLRDYNKLKYICLNYQFENINENEIINILGKPDTFTIESNRKTLSYYFSSYCDTTGRIIDSTDFCWLSIIIETKEAKNQVYNTCL
jgi:hypothetical protein